MMKQAQEHMDAGQFAEAEAIYRTFISEDGSNTQAIFMLALARQAQDDLDEAISLMAQAAGQEPDNTNIHYTLATLYISQKAVDEARKSYLLALQADPLHIDSHNGLAFVELIAGNFKAAEIAANLALGEDSRNVQALVYLGTAKLEQGDATKAIAYLQEALKESPEHQSAQLQLGRAFLAAENKAFAMQCFQNIVDADRSSAVAWEYLAIAQRANGLLAEAGVSFQAALSLGRKSQVVMDGLKELQAAAQEQGSTIEQAPADPELLFTSAELEIALGNPEAALKILQNPVPGDSQRATLLMAKAHEQMRNHDAALALIEPVVKAGQSADEVSLAYVRLLSKAGRQEVADKWIEELLASDQPPLFARMFRGFQLCQSGDKAGIKVLQDLETDESLSKVDQRRIHKTLAASLDRSGRYTEAAAYYEMLTGRLAQVVSVAESCGKENRSFLESGTAPATAARVNLAILPADPVFMFAWPGSGWEWLAAGLGAHSRLMLVADKPETQVKRRSLVSFPAGQLELDAFTGEAAGLVAGQYWADLASGKLEPGNKTTLDAMWISADMLPTIARIFPAARVIVVKRDPRDMVLDWFRSGYADLQDMAAIYRDQCKALEQYRELLDIEFIEVDGNALQSGALAGFEKLCEALNLPWEDAVGARLQAIAPTVDKNRGQWSDYSESLAGPLNLFSES